MQAARRPASRSRRSTGSTASTAICSDTWGIEARPNDTGPDVFQPWHWVTIPAIGIVHGEIFYLKELAEDCAADRVYEFFFCAPSLVISRGTGSSINPQAIK